MTDTVITVQIEGPQGVDGPVPWAPVAAWTIGATYQAAAPASVVSYADNLYVCTTAHTAGASFDGSKWNPVIDLSALVSGRQPLSAVLTALAAISPAANKLVYATSPSAFALADLTSYGRSVVAASNAGGLKTLLYLAKADVALGNVDNTSDAGKPVSTAQQTALDLKAPLASPALTGTPTAPTATLGTNTTQIATMAAIQAAIANLINSAPGALDTLNELAAALGNDANFSTTVTNALAGKQPLDGLLTALAALTTSANKMAYFTGADAVALADLTSYGRTLMALADQAAGRTALGLDATSSTPTPASGFTAVGLSAVKKLDRVIIAGYVSQTAATVAQYATIMTLASGYRPAAVNGCMLYYSGGSAGDGTAAGRILTDGQVQVVEAGGLPNCANVSVIGSFDI